MTTLFTIGSSRIGADALLIEAGEDFCCYALMDTHKKSFDLLKYYSFDPLQAEKELGAILNELDRGFDKVIISSAYVQALLTPPQFSRSNHDMINLVYDEPGPVNLVDQVQEWQVNTVYSMPFAIHKLFVDQYPVAQFFHTYTPALRVYNGFSAPDQVDIHFSTSHFRVIVKREGGLQLAQIYSYKTPLDVVYYLLKIFQEFEMQQSEALLIVSGLVEQDSALYTELHNYFAHIHFAQAPAFTVPQNDLPAYYFSSIFNLAACVS